MNNKLYIELTTRQEYNGKKQKKILAAESLNQVEVRMVVYRLVSNKITTAVNGKIHTIAINEDEAERLYDEKTMNRLEKTHTGQKLR